MEWFDYLLWFLVAVCLTALCWLSYLQVQLNIDDEKRRFEYEKTKHLGGAE